VTLETILDELRAEKDRLDRAIAALESGRAVAARRGKGAQGKKRIRRHMSLAARKRLSEFKKRWWAEGPGGGHKRSRS
jgi:exonuclease VII small subunit